MTQSHYVILTLRYIKNLRYIISARINFNMKPNVFYYVKYSAIIIISILDKIKR